MAVVLVRFQDTDLVAVVINVAGPFMLTGGEALVEACIEYDTDYVDVNGEIPYAARLLEWHEPALKAADVLSADLTMKNTWSRLSVDGKVLDEKACSAPIAPHLTPEGGTGG